MDITQVMIVISLLVVSVAIGVCTFYFVGLIKEIRITVTKVNTILDDAERITDSISRPVSSFSEFLMGFRNGVKVFNTFFKKDR